MLFLPIYGKNKMPEGFGRFIVGVSGQQEGENQSNQSMQEMS